MSTPAATPTPEPTPSSTPSPTPSPTPESVVTPDPTVTPVPTFVPLTAADIKFADGLTINDTDRDAFLGVLNDQNLSTAQRAQALIDMQHRLSQEASDAGSQAWNDMQTTWQNEARTTLGDAFEASMTDIGGLVQEFGSDELRQVMDLTGAGNNVHVIQFLAKVAGVLKEGRPTPVPTPPPTMQSVADKIYNNTPKS